MKLGLSVAPPGRASSDFLAVGEVSLDLMCRAGEFPRPDTKPHLKSFERLPGGQAATAAVGCARLGWRSRFVGAVGADPAGLEVLGALKREGVEVHAVTRAGAPTRCAVVLSDERTRSRTILAYRDPRLDVAEYEIDVALLQNSRVVLVDATDPALARRAAAAARAAGARTLVDIDEATDGAAEFLRLIDVVIVPAGFVTAFTGRRDVGAALAELGRSVPAAAVVVTLGQEGAVAWCRGVELRVDAHPVAVVDTTGAGDAFRAGFAAAWLSAGGADPDLETLLDVAGRVAALSCRAVGAQTALPTLDELRGADFPVV